MSDERQPDCQQASEAAAYLLGVHERPQAFREHAHGCETCRHELERLRPTVEGLATSVEQVQAPAQMKSRLLDRVSADAELLRAAGPEADRPPRREARSRPLLVAVVALSVALVAVGAGLLASRSGSSTHTTYATLAPSVAGASAVLRQLDGRAELVVAHMPQAPPGKVYEVWLKRPGAPPQATDALFGVTARGSGAVAVPAGLGRVSQVLVTSEPRGGSAHPTKPPLLTFDLAPRA